MFLVVDVTNNVSIADGPRGVVDAADATAAAQVFAEQSTLLGRRDFLVFDVASGVAVSNEAVRSVQPVVEEPAPNPGE